jgi:osmoprotectant transport system substrate-binding protein
VSAPNWRSVGLLGIVLTVGLLAGLRAGGSAIAVTKAGSKLMTTAPASATGSSTLTQPKVTAVPQTTTTPVSRLPGHDRPTITVGDMNTPEQFVLGALYQVALQHAGYTVEITRNIGAFYIAQEALRQGSLDIYPDYLDSDLLPSWDRSVAHLTVGFRSVKAAYAAGAHYATKHGFHLLKPTPGGDTFGLAVRTQFAHQNHVKSMAQLAHAPLLTFGMPLGFGGLWRAEKGYGFKPGVVTYVDTGVQYSALDTGSIQVAYAGSTDPQLGEPAYTFLDDPKHVYGFGNVVPVTTPKVVRAEGPAFLRIINRVDSLLTTRALRGLNAEVQLMGHDQIGVAEQFLQGNGLLPPDTYQVIPSG